jgi:hypothetical protein
MSCAIRNFECNFECRPSNTHFIKYKLPIFAAQIADYFGNHICETPWFVQSK